MIHHDELFCEMLLALRSVGAAFLNLNSSFLIDFDCYRLNLSLLRTRIFDLTSSFYSFDFGIIGNFGCCELPLFHFLEN